MSQEMQQISWWLSETLLLKMRSQLLIMGNCDTKKVYNDDAIWHC